MLQLHTGPSPTFIGRPRTDFALGNFSLFHPPTRNPVMKAWSVVSLLFTAATLSTTPVSPQVTPRGVELSVDQAQAQATYGGYRRAKGYRATAAGYGYGGAVYGYGAAGYRVEPAGYGRWCNVYPSGFRWCWTDYASGYSGLNPQPLPPSAPPR